MIQADTFVGSLAIILGIAAGVAAFLPIEHSASLRGVRTIQDRFGNSSARAILAIVASVLLASGIMIVRDLRPEFADPVSGSKPANRSVTNE